MTADQLPRLTDYGVGESLRHAVAVALQEQEGKSQLPGDLTTADQLHVFLTAALAASNANIAAG